MNIPGHAGLTLGLVYSAGYLVDALAARRSQGPALRQVPRLGRLWRRARAMPASVQRLGMDLRLLFLGALLPDVIDKPLGLWLLPQAVSHSTRSAGHSLLFSAILLAAALAALKWRRRAWLLPVALGSMGHLALDQMWQSPVTLLWPLLGWRFPEPAKTLEEWLASHLISDLRSPAELAGALILAWFAFQLYQRRAVRRFLRTGRAE